MNKITPRDLRITTPLQLGEILRRRRKARKLTQQELAEKLDLSQGRLSTLEVNPSSLSVSRLLSLANLLGLELVLRERAEGARGAEW